jgi:hypothetical protein
MTTIFVLGPTRAKADPALLWLSGHSDDSEPGFDIGVASLDKPCKLA